MSSPRRQLLRRKPADCVSLRDVADHAMAAETGAMPAKASQPLSAQIGKGSTWDEAVNDIAWSDGDVLVVGSSSLSRRLNRRKPLFAYQNLRLARDRGAG